MARITGAHLRAWRQWAGWDVPETARQLRRAAGDDPHIATHDSLVRQIRRRERENSGASERHILLYARALGITPAQLGGEPPSAAQDGQDSGGKALARWMVSDEAEPQTVSGELIRSVRRDAAAMGGRSFLDELADHAIELSKWAEASNVGDGTVEQLDDAIQRVARGHLSSPLEPLIQRASDISRRVLDLPCVSISGYGTLATCT